MILRRLTRHVQDQNWFAVAIDFVIVVVGVFVGLQVSNWNDGVRVNTLEKSYLSRLSEEVADNIEAFEAESEFARESRRVLGQFLQAVNGESTQDDDLVQATVGYISVGALLPDFKPSQATFDDLKSTGNLDIIQNRELRKSLVELYAHYDAGIASFLVNVNWILPTDSDIYMGFDALRFDARTSVYFPLQDDEETSENIRANRTLLTRHAALHFWMKDRSLEILEDATDRSRTVLQMIREAQ